MKGLFFVKHNNLYKGKSTKDGKWIMGYLIGNDVIVGEVLELNDEYFVTEFWHRVDPETVEKCKDKI